MISLLYFPIIKAVLFLIQLQSSVATYCHVVSRSSTQSGVGIRRDHQFVPKVTNTQRRQFNEASELKVNKAILGDGLTFPHKELSTQTSLARIIQGSCEQTSPDRFPYDLLVVLGDSISCTGNFMLRHDGVNNKLYHNGRYSDSLVWHEYLAQYVKTETIQPKIKKQRFRVINEAFAHACALEASIAAEAPRVPYLSQQVDRHLNRPWKVREARNPLFTIWIGGNDYINIKSPVRPEYIISAIRAQMVRISEHVPNANFLVASLPPGELLPKCPNLLKKKVKAKMDKHRDLLKEMVEEFDPTGQRAVFVDMTSYLRQVIEHPSDYGFGDAIRPCLTDNETINGDPLKHVFLDSIHFTSRVHMMMARHVFDILLANKN